ncbi:uncharacterized protein IWZ02DRAFT_281532 [Phyllosticta citriasiana]|uniref:uncharacterized protein n=1 Tax=Phyllosticta citriasiana TaxID=595635 RepID=UPI0030FD9EF7
MMRMGRGQLRLCSRRAGSQWRRSVLHCTVQCTSTGNASSILRPVRRLLSTASDWTASIQQPHLWPCFEPVPFQKLQNGAAISSSTCQKHPALCMRMYAELQTAPLRLAASPAPSSWASQTELEKENDDRLKVVLMATVDIGLSGAPCIASKVARLGRCRCRCRCRCRRRRRRRRRCCSQLSKDLASCAPTREDCPRVKPDASRRPDSRVCIHPPRFLRDSLQSRPSVGAFGLFCSALLCSALLCALTMSRCRFSPDGSSATPAG